MTHEAVDPLGRVYELFQQAREIAEDQRETFVRLQAGDNEQLCAEVLALLTAIPASDPRTLVNTVRSVAAGIASDSDGPGRIGPYRLLHKLGEGGMGTVYLCEQEEPVKRRVALKLIKLGMDSKAVVARFEQERQALALMQHDGIAKVFDCGTTELGQPFFVMEYVKGVPLTQYCDDHKVDLAGRLQLMRGVCSAVQHAHQKGVVHRDLKPGNVLVVDEGGNAQPKIIDFGLAKAMGQKLIENSFFSEPGMILGTPEYMPPEQADPTNADIDTRADIYSLGVILYELLIGQLPFTRLEFQRAGLIGMQRMLREQEPQRPSTKLSTLGATSSAVAAARRISLPSLRKALANDLDWVALKCLEKDRNRRYETAAGLGADLQRFLDHEPLVAGPPSAAYRLRKLVRRYRAQVIGATAVLVTALLGATVAVGYAIEAGQQKTQAENKALEAQNQTMRADAQAKETEARRREAQSNLDRFNLLADVVKLREAKASEQTLYPAFPEQVPAMQAWLATVARPLAERLPWIRLARDEIGACGVPVPGAPSRSTTSSSPTPNLRFQNDSDRFLHEAMSKLAEDLTTFVGEKGELAAVEARLAEARTIQKRSIDDHRAEWDAAIEAIAKEPKYGGLRIKAQIGLVPIGADPESKLWEFAHLPSGHLPGRNLQLERLLIENDTGIVFVLIPAGTFWMGAQKTNLKGQNYNPSALRDESPVRQVPLGAYFLSKYEMTRGQWERLSRGEQPSINRLGTFYKNDLPITATNPVEGVDWRDCDVMMRRHGLLLPTEAQWEYGCRAGTTTIWSAGDQATKLAEYANVLDAKAGEHYPAWGKAEEFRDGFSGPAPVGSLRANGFGLHDMHGNVWEWCRDIYGRYEGKRHPGDGLLVNEQGSNRRVFRGGSFDSPATYASSSIRTGTDDTTRGGIIGLRPARALTQ